jgi:hypothetical protein
MKDHIQVENKGTGVHVGTVDALCSYMRDCGMEASHLAGMTLALALEYVYQPAPTFWREFDIAFVLNAMDQHIPDWRTVVNRKTANRADELAREIEGLLRQHAFDESNAERIRALPADERPCDATSASDWIHAELTRRGLHEDAVFAARDGNRCGEAALEILHCLEQTQKGIPAERLGTGVARICRDKIMKGHGQTTAALMSCEESVT